MRNKVQDGKSINVTLAAAITSGDPLGISDMVGVASVDGEIGDNIAFRTEGVFRCPKLTTDVVVQGDTLNWDASAGEFILGATAAAGDVTAAGVAWEDAGNGVTEVAVKLNAVGGTGS
jgi:predicted RecA/RadA family phage recombinase